MSSNRWLFRLLIKGGDGETLFILLAAFSDLEEKFKKSSKISCKMSPFGLLGKHLNVSGEKMGLWK